MIKAAEEASMAIIRDFGELEKLQVSRKGIKSFVTSADKFAERKISELLSKARPDFSFMREESGTITNSLKETWIIDPIDGTNNFMRGIPYFAINIALSNNDEIVSCVTFDPLRCDCFCSDKGSGAFLGNRNRLRVSGRESLHESFIAINLPIEDIRNFSSEIAIFRKTGSVALDLAYLAAGKYDAVIAKNVGFWDVASGILLIKEAGGFLNCFKQPDDQYSIFAASSSKLLTQIEKFS
ncbi:MAG: inositol monophosphatase [Holosporales bacterium]|jgi:myo-inositol-1(or 4)-monophosphatase|nr:inositol monophosphatase [Holosporales bacterium]